MCNELNLIRNKHYDEDKWIINYLNRNDIGLSLTELGLKVEDFYDEKYQFELSEDEENNIDYEKFSEKDYIHIYKYITDTYGPKGYGENSRPFCIKLMSNQDKVYKMEDIAKLNNAPGKANRAGGGGYSVLKFRGGLNCKHKWCKYTYDQKEKKLIEKDFIQPAQPII